jgi:hypothetical protein
MNKVLATIVFLALLAGCHRANDLQLNADRISSIEVVQVVPNNQSQPRQITDKAVIGELVNCLNRADKTLNKFYPSYQLVLHSSTKQDSILVSGNCLKMKDGRRYVATCNIKSLIR